ncbi:MAG: two-component system response regulator [Spirochaetales bacterium]|nr:MAG: two-component system response regulator [Spirochaetales bacterium]
MMRILIVDDLAFMRTLIRDILESAGHEVVAEAADGRQALLLRRAWKPEVTLMDISMPRMDGLEALRRIRLEDPAASVVMCSSLGDQKQILEAIRLGASDYVVKPFPRERLLSALSKAAGNKRRP